MITEERLAELLPGVITWLEKVAAEAEGRPLDAEQVEIARRVGVKNPEKVRLVVCEKLPLPADPAIVDVCGGAAAFEIAAALTVGYTIWIKCEKDPRVPGLLRHPDGTKMNFGEAIAILEFQHREAALNREKFRSTLNHELRHVFHHEEAGSIARFAELNWRETIKHGYQNNRFEVDARKYEIPAWRGAATIAAVAEEELSTGQKREGLSHG